jgi:hypothetical protein
MKPRLTTDLLRGILLAYAMYQFYMWTRVSISKVPQHSDELALAILTSLVVIGPQLFLIVALLAKRAPKSVFACILFFTLHPLVTQSHLFLHPLAHETLIVTEFVRMCATVIALIYCLRVCNEMALTNR